MATVAQLSANRLNALKSTGPRTAAGKQRSAQNAVKWGLFSRHVVLTPQDAREWEQLSLRIREILQPVGDSEELLADEVIANWFRLARCLKVDAGLFNAYSTFQGKACGMGTAFAQAARLDCFGKLSRYEQHLEKKLALSLQRLQSARRTRQESPPPDPATETPVISQADPVRDLPAKSLALVASSWRVVVAKVTAIWRPAEASNLQDLVHETPLAEKGTL